MTSLTLRKTSPCSDTFTDACARRSSAMSRIPLPSYRTDLSAKYPANSADKNRRITRNGHMMALTRLYTRIFESSCKTIKIQEEERKERKKKFQQAVQKIRFQAPRTTKQKRARKEKKASSGAEKSPRPDFELTILAHKTDAKDWSICLTSRHREQARSISHAERRHQAGGRAHARVCAQKNREKIRGDDSEEERWLQQWTKRVFSNNCDFVSASEGDE